MKRNHIVSLLLFSFLSLAAFSQQKQQEKKQPVKEVITNSGEKNIPRDIQQKQLQSKPENLKQDKRVAKSPSFKKKACCAKCKRKTSIKKSGA